jgi:high-affinity nickel-transport protein
MADATTLTHARRATFGALAVVAGLHLAGIALLLSVMSPVVVGAALAAYLLGLRHAFDADHIAAIDGSVRALLDRGRRPEAVGLMFSMGHSTVVLLTSAALILVGGPIIAPLLEDGSPARFIASIVGPAVAGTYLLTIAAVNTVALVRIRRFGVSPVRRHAAAGESRARAWHMYPLGLLFGLGLDTTVSVVALVVAATAAATSGTTPLVGLLALPVLFAAGMSFGDTADSLAMTRAYSWAGGDQARMTRYRLIVTSISILAAVIVGIPLLAGALSTATGAGGPLADLAGWSWPLTGFALVGVFLAVWGAAATIARSQRVQSART